VFSVSSITLSTSFARIPGQLSGVQQRSTDLSSLSEGAADEDPGRKELGPHHEIFNGDRLRPGLYRPSNGAHTRRTRPGRYAAHLPKW